METGKEKFACTMKTAMHKSTTTLDTIMEQVIRTRMTGTGHSPIHVCLAGRCTPGNRQ
jgi:hypothetical protein